MGYELEFTPVLRNIGFLLEGAWVTLWISVVTSLLGFLLGATIAVAKVYGPRSLRWVANGYIEFWRNSPLIVQLFLFYFGLPSFGIRLSPVAATVAVFTLNAAGYIAEIVRGGMAAVDRGQYEAAYSLALTRRQILRHIVLPPALKAAAPALGNQFILITLATSLASIISTPELTFQATLLDTQIFRSFEVYLVILVMYLVIARTLMVLLRTANRRAFRTNRLSNVPRI